MKPARLLAVVTIVAAFGCSGSQASDPASGQSTPAPSEPAATAAPTADPTAAATASPQSGELIGVPIAKKPEGEGAGASDTTTGSQSVEIVYVEKAKAGGKRLLFDVTLRNQRKEPRWFVLPAVLHPQDKMLQGGVDGIELFTLKGDSKVTMGRFTGKGGFHAVLLPGGAELKVQKLPIECHFATLKECAVPIEVVIAGKMSIGGEPADKWFGGKALSEAKGEVTYEGVAVKTGGKKAGGVKEVALEESKKVKLTLIIGAT